MSEFQTHKYQFNKWYHQQIRKKIEDKRQIGKYHRKRNKDKPLRFKKSNSALFTLSCLDVKENYQKNSDCRDTIHTNEVTEFGRCGCYKLERPQPSWIALDMVQQLFDCIDNLIINVHYDYRACPCCHHPHYNPYPVPASYYGYLYRIPPRFQFCTHIDKFKPLISKCLEHLCDSEYVDVLNCDQNALHKHLIHVIKEIMYDYETCGDYCGECYTKSDRYGFLLDWFLFDMQTIISTTKMKIKLKQSIQMNMIEKYNQIYSKQSWTTYICKVININGITTGICALILDFVSFEYPPLFYNHPKIRHWISRCEQQYSCGSIAYVSRDTVENAILESLPGYGFYHLFNLESLEYDIVVLHSDTSTYKKIGNVAGIFMCSELVFVYFLIRYDRDTYKHSVKFYNMWAQLWNQIKNTSIKINCYKSISQMVEKVATTKSIITYTHSRKSIVKTRNNRAIPVQLVTRRPSTDKQIKQNPHLFDREERIKYDHRVRGTRKYLMKRIATAIGDVKKSNIHIQKRIFKRENMRKKLEHMKKLQIRAKFRACVSYRKKILLVNGYIHCLEKQYNIHCFELIIPMDICELIFAMFYSK
eukprot:368875_1